MIVYGRSDTTLNPGGIRIGTAEIYRIVESMDEIGDSLVIGLEQDNDIRMVLFVVLNKEGSPLAPLKEKIKQKIRAEATPRHVPHEIYQVHEIPKTLNGKKMESAIRDLFQGQPLTNKSSMVNRDCLKAFEEIHSHRLAVKSE